MRITKDVWLVVRRRKRHWYGLEVAIRVRKPQLKLGEVGIQLRLQIDEQHFEQPILQCSVDAPASDKSDLRAEIARVEQIVRDNSKLEVRFQIFGVGK